MFISRIRISKGHLTYLASSALRDTRRRNTLKMSAAQNSTSIHSDFNRINRQAHPNVVTTVVNPGECQLEADGVFNSDSFYPNGHLTVSAILTALDLNAKLMYWRTTGPQYLDVGKLGYLTFISSMKLSCEPELYDFDLAKQPVRVVNNLVYVGNTSFKTSISLYLPQVKKPVAQKEFGVVFVDPDTRRPVAPPAWWREKHAPYSRPGEGRIQVPRFDFRAGSSRPQQQEEEVYVQTIDLDANRHCHFTSFVRFCVEAYGRSQFRRFGQTSRGDPFRDVKSLVCTFKGEASLGDLLKVSFVQDPVDKDTYRFQIVGQQQEAVLFECHLTFFPQPSSKI